MKRFQRPNRPGPNRPGQMKAKPAQKPAPAPAPKVPKTELEMKQHRLNIVLSLAVRKK